VVRKIEKFRGGPIKGAGRVKGAGAAVPLDVVGPLRRAWHFARKMAKAFSKNLLKNREDEFLKQVRRHF
jgi:hypothetical protein